MKLSEEQKQFLVKAWATRHRAHEIQRMFKEAFGADIEKAQVYRYNVDYPSNCVPGWDGRMQIAQNLQDLFHDVRRIYDKHAETHHPLYQKAGRLAEKAGRHAWLKESLDRHGELLTPKEMREMSRELSALETEIADDLGQKTATKIDITKLPTEQIIAILESGNEG